MDFKKQNQKLKIDNISIVRRSHFLTKTDQCPALHLNPEDEFFVISALYFVLSLLRYLNVNPIDNNSMKGT